jgi:phage gp29-like protein
MTRGIWTSDTTFHNFAEPSLPTSTTEQIATRARSGDYSSLFGLLPNPDTVLRKMGKQINVYRELASDAHVKGCLRRRRGAVKAMERGFDRGDAKGRVAKNLKAIFDDLPMSKIIEQACAGADYGYQPFEVLWGLVGSMKVPLDVVAKPPEWFGYDQENQLRFKSRGHWIEGELLPPMRFLVARNNPSYLNPYGEADLASVFWPTTFKRGGLKFWVTFTEKYGMPWAVGKQPRTATPDDANALADKLDRMVRDAVAVVPDDSSVELLTVATSANSDMFEKLLHFCRSETSIALLGNNQSIEASANLASATAAQAVEADLRDAMSEMVMEMLQELATWVARVNWGDNVQMPLYELWEQEEVDDKLAKRDETLTKAGAKFSPQYFKDAYGLKDGDLDVNAMTAPPPVAPGAPGAKPLDPAAAAAEFAEGVLEVPADQAALDGAIEQLPAEQLDAAMRTMLAPALAAIGAAETADGVRQALLDAYPNMDFRALEELMARAFFVADLVGSANAAQA